MKNINLLPRKPYYQEHFRFLISCLLIGYALAALLLFFAFWSADQEREQRMQEIESITQSIEQLQSDRAPDPKLALLQRFQTVVSDLEQSQKDWFPILDGVVSPLPAASRIVNATYQSSGGTGGEEMLQVEMQFRSLHDAAEYVGELRTSSLFAEVTIENIVKEMDNLHLGSVSDAFANGDDDRNISYYTLIVNIQLEARAETEGEPT